MPIIDENVVQFKSKPAKHSIDNFSCWLSAWSIYERVLVEAYPSLYPVLSDYRMFIHKCDSKYQWHAVFAYDCRFRAQLADSQNKYAYNNIDTNLYVTIFDILSVRQDAKVCYRCKSPDHLVTMCPFLTTAKEEKTKKGSTQRQQAKQPHWYHNGIEGCNNYQSGNCHYQQCQRAHVCRLCRGEEPLYKCSKCKDS